jgi:POT family proton-dependent oligopeptide transporter
MSINVGALLATILAPKLMESPYGPLTIFAVVFVGKAIAALNFSLKISLYDDVVAHLDKKPMSWQQLVILITYLLSVYLFTLTAYLHPEFSGKIIATGCSIGITWFLCRTLKLRGSARSRQLIAILLIIEAIVFFVLYNQMNTTLILFAKKHSDLTLFGFHVSSAHYQMINPLVIILMSFILPSVFRRSKQFTIPFQFAVGTLLAGFSLIILWAACFVNQGDVISGNYIGLTYFIMTIAELFVSAVGLSMIGLYCDKSMTAFAMGVWYLANSLSNIISSYIAQSVATPQRFSSSLSMMSHYQRYYLDLGISAVLLGGVMLLCAFVLTRQMQKRGLRVA